MRSDSHATGGDAIILEARNISKRFAGLVAVDNLSFQARQGNIIAIIGPNGAGKTTVFNLISGLLSPSSGEIWFKGQRIDKLNPHQIASLGVARTFQQLEIFHSMSVLENIIVGYHLKGRSGIFDSTLSLPSTRREKKLIFDMAMAGLQRVGLEDKAFEPSTSLGMRQQRLLEIARALAVGPSLLLLDEPAAGLSVEEIAELVKVIYEIQDSGVTVLIVEHLMRMVMDIADWVVVLNYGVKIAEGAPGEIQKDEKVIATYLGEEI